MWQTGAGRIVATRFRRADASRDRVEVRVVLDLDPSNPTHAQQQARVAVATVCIALEQLSHRKGVQ
ncbi:hypothetical protein F4553_003049 [Allocatelliglobosispora scoriae]|uniref:Uncharacterized protein n=1 Tax=Allocatelliglobosispora scoriae TaxID=643052 RepID=A0A841BS97_9ACTN|nr:hypothetical protein [Allocatelliglobosispora scoriae]MBB5869670.1 hypothetical protein [Allocatelliglobosispora scoriae]